MGQVDRHGEAEDNEKKCRDYSQETEQLVPGCRVEEKSEHGWLVWGC